MTGRKPTYRERKARARTTANRMREWLADARTKRDEQVKRQRRVDLLTGEVKRGGSGITVEMREISMEAAARDVEWVVEHKHPNRQTRRRHALTGPRQFVNGRYVHAMAPGQNVPYVAPREVRRD